MTVNELTPGDVITLPVVNESATFLLKIPHPKYHGLMLVVWRLHRSGREFSYDALDPRQDVGELVTHGNVDSIRNALEDLR